MPAKVYYDNDADLAILRGKTVAVIGYGSQGHAHALNLKESGIDVIVGLRPGKSWEKAQADGLTVVTVDEAVRRTDVIMVLVDDELQAGICGVKVKTELRGGEAVAIRDGLRSLLE